MQGQVDVLGLTEACAQDLSLADALRPCQVDQVHLGLPYDLLPDLPLHPRPLRSVPDLAVLAMGVAERVIKCMSPFA